MHDALPRPRPSHTHTHPPPPPHTHTYVRAHTRAHTPFPPTLSSSPACLPSGLGVTLKCACQHVSTPYKYVRACDVKHLKGLDADLAEALLELQVGRRAGGGGRS